MKNLRLKWLLQRLQQEFNLAPGNLEHLRSHLRTGKSGCSETHWFVLEGISSQQLEELENLMQEFQQCLLQVELGESWSMNVWNQGLLVPTYQVTIKTCLKGPRALFPLKRVVAEETNPVW